MVREPSNSSLKDYAKGRPLYQCLHVVLRLGDAASGTYAGVLDGSRHSAQFFVRAGFELLGGLQMEFGLFQGFEIVLGDGSVDGALWKKETGQKMERRSPGSCGVISRRGKLLPSAGVDALTSAGPFARFAAGPILLRWAWELRSGRPGRFPRNPLN